MTALRYVSLVFENVLTYRTRTVIPLADQGLVCLRGETIDRNTGIDPNGAGKSTIFKVLSHLQFPFGKREASEKISAGSLKNKYFGNGFADLRLTDDKGDLQITLSDHYPDMRHGLHCWRNGTLLTPDRDKRTSAKIIERELGFGYLEYSALISLGEMAREVLILGQPSRRRAYLRDIFGLDAADLVIERIKKRRAALNIDVDQYNHLRGQRRTLAKQLAEPKDEQKPAADLDKLAAQAESAQRLLRELTKERKLLANYFKLKVQIAELPTVDGNPQQAAAQAAQELGKLTARRDELAKKIRLSKIIGRGTIPDAADLNERLARIRTKKGRSRRAWDLRRQIKRTMNLGERCPTCQRPITASERAAMKKRLNEPPPPSTIKFTLQEATVEQRLKVIEQQRRALETLGNRRYGEQDRNELEQQIVKQEKSVKQAVALVSASGKRTTLAKMMAETLAQLGQEPKSGQLRKVAQQAKQQEQAVADAQHRLEQAKQRLALYNERIRSRTKIQEELNRIDHKLAKFAERREQDTVYEYLRIAAKNLRDQQFKKLFAHIRTFLPLYFAKIFRESTCSIRTEHDEEMGIDLILRRQYGKRVDELKPDDISKGEREKMNLAFILTARRLRHASFPVNFCSFDELLSHVSPVGEEAVLQTLAEDGKLLDLTQVYVTQKLDMMAHKDVFDHEWLARKVNGVTNLIIDR